jgi:thioredoxin reductase
MTVRLRIDAFGTSRSLDPARAYWIGTSAEADIVVKSKLAAPIHALVSCEAGSWTIQVVGAAPPIQVSGRALAPGAPPIPLGPGLVLEIGGDTLRVQKGDAATTPSLTRAGETVALLLGKSWLAAEGPPPAFRILFPGGAEGPRREAADVREDRVVVGSAPDCRVRIEGAFVAPHVLAIVRRPGGFWVEPLLTPLPPDVVLLEEDRALRTGDRLVIGACDLRFAIEAETAGINVQQRLRPELAAAQGALRTIAMPAAALGRAAASRTEAPRYRRTSDLVRARLLLPLALVLAIAVGGVVALGTGADAGTRTIGAHHAAAGLGCTSCHAEGGRVMTEACAGCHVPATPPSEPTHAKLSRAGRPPHAALTCTACHRIHTGRELVVARRGPGAVVVAHTLDDATLSEATLSPTHPLGPYLPEGRVVAWPVVRTARCMTCHHPESPADPSRHCVADLTDAAALPVTCDDEHREEPTPEAATGAVARRAVLFPGSDLAAARLLGATVLARVAGAPGSGGGGGGPLGALHAAAAGLVLCGVLLGAALSRRPFVAPAAAVSPRTPAGAAAAPATAMVGKKLVPTVNASTCIGCGACVESCPRGVLALHHFWAEVVAPEACCGFMLCEAVCPNRSLSIVEGEPPTDRPRVGDDRQSADVPGLWLAGDVAGAPLIRLAIHDGIQAVDAIGASLAGAPAAAGVLDLAVVGAGPAGLAGLFRARELGLTAAAFEKGDAAQTIQLFPRAKLVRVLPLDLPLVGTLPLEAGKDGGVSKEALLTQWLRLVREEGLDVRERQEVRGIRPVDGGAAFELDLLVQPRGRGAPEPQAVRARRVLVAIGRRGTPKPLEAPIDPTMAGRVAYHLADAAALRGLTVGISGLGDTAMEAAIALGEQDATPVHVVYRGAELRTAGRDTRNVRHFRDLVGRGRITVHWSSSIARVEPGAMVLHPESRIRIDQLLVFHGGTTPKELLARFGVRTGG